jgi:hypothetical protein
MLIYMTNGKFDSTKHTFEVEPPKDFGKNRRPRPSNVVQKEQVCFIHKLFKAFFVAEKIFLFQGIQ